MLGIIANNQNLPTEVDFDPYQGCLDCQHAWREFGGLSIEEAFQKFIDHPMCHQEDFMFMGGRAFVYYFPVLDRYLRGFRADEDSDDAYDSFAAVIGGGLSVQLLSKTSQELDSIMDGILSLIGYVRSHTTNLAVDLNEQQSIDSAWQILEALISQKLTARKKKAEKRKPTIKGAAKAER